MNECVCAILRELGAVDVAGEEGMVLIVLFGVALGWFFWWLGMRRLKYI